MRKVSYIVERADGTKFETDNYAVASDVRIKNRIVKTILTNISEELSPEQKDRYRARIKRILAYYKAKAAAAKKENA